MRVGGGGGLGCSPGCTVLQARFDGLGGGGRRGAGGCYVGY